MNILAYAILGIITEATIKKPHYISAENIVIRYRLYDLALMTLIHEKLIYELPTKQHHYRLVVVDRGV